MRTLFVLCLLLASPSALADDVTPTPIAACPEGSRCVERARREQCVLDARALVRERAELDLRQTDITVLQRQYQALGVTLDRTALALQAERSRWSALTWWTLGVGAGVVASALAVVAGILLSN